VILRRVFRSARLGRTRRAVCVVLDPPGFDNGLFLEQQPKFSSFENRRGIGR
jgi:hypothetical protein